MMSRTLKKKLLPAAMAVALASGFTFSGNANAINLAEDGIGQALLAPMYWAGDAMQSGRDYNTEFAITNTRTDTAVKVKVVFRSRLASTECLDFICYMSPSDVCRFTAGRLSNGSTGVSSTDDSMKAALPDGASGTAVDSLAAPSTVFASQRQFEAAWAPVQLGTGDSCDMGHVEIMGAYAVQNAAVGYNSRGQKTAITILRGMSKYNLAQIFDTPRMSKHLFLNPPVHRVIALGPDGAQGSLDDLTLSLANNATNGSTREQDVRNTVTGIEPLSSLNVVNAPNIRSTDPSWIRLMGTAVISTTGDRMSYKIPALAGAIGDNVDDDAEVLGFQYIVPDGIPRAGDVIKEVPADYAMFDGLVVSNPTFDMTVAQENAIGRDMGVRPILGVFPGVGAPDQDKLVEIEHALATSSQQGHYDISGTNVTYLQTTLPTRYTHFFRDPCNTGFAFNSTAGRLYSPPFEIDGGMAISISLYDDFENTEIPTGGVFISPAPIVVTDVIRLAETNYYVPNWVADFERGWFSVTLSRQTNSVAGDNRGCPYPGAPALGNVHTYVDSNGTATQSDFVPMAHQPVLTCSEATGVESCPTTFQ